MSQTIMSPKECFDSSYQTSEYVYDDISGNISDLIENALEHKAPK